MFFISIQVMSGSLLAQNGYWPALCRNGVFMEQPEEFTGEDIPLWQYVKSTDYQIPSAPVVHSARERLAVFRELFHRPASQDNATEHVQQKLSPLPRCQMDCVVPAPEWNAAAEELNKSLEHWRNLEDKNNPLVILVSPPFSGNSEILTAWAKGQSWRIIQPPSTEQIFYSDHKWLKEQESYADKWVLPSLESTYFRHADGLKLIRYFLTKACAGGMGRGVICCDSWAWAFLSHIWPGRKPLVLTLQSFDQQRLALYFRSLVGSTDKGATEFRQSDNGHYVMKPLSPENKHIGMSNYLQILASYSRGILGVALPIWRLSMQIESDYIEAEEEKKKPLNLANRTIWITPWKDIVLPLMYSDAGQNEAFILQTILFHRSLSLDVLQRIVPLSPDCIMTTLYKLLDCDLVTKTECTWQVNPQGYPVVRRFLENSGFCVDQF